MSAETAMWGDPAATDRVEECVKDALDDRERLLKWWDEGRALWLTLHEMRVTLCDNGCGLDIGPIIDGFKPHSKETVEKRAREVAWDRENV